MNHLSQGNAIGADQIKLSEPMLSIHSFEIFYTYRFI